MAVTHRVFFGERMAAEVVLDDVELDFALRAMTTLGSVTTLCFKGEEVEYWIRADKIVAIQSIAPPPPPPPPKPIVKGHVFEGRLVIDDAAGANEATQKVLVSLFAKYRENGLTLSEVRNRFDLLDSPYRLEISE